MLSTIIEYPIPPNLDNAHPTVIVIGIPPDTDVVCIFVVKCTFENECMTVPFFVILPEANSVPLFDPCDPDEVQINKSS